MFVFRDLIKLINGSYISQILVNGHSHVWVLNIRESDNLLWYFKNCVSLLVNTFGLQSNLHDHLKILGQRNFTNSFLSCESCLCDSQMSKDTGMIY